MEDFTVVVDAPPTNTIEVAQPTPYIAEVVQTPARTVVDTVDTVSVDTLPDADPIVVVVAGPQTFVKTSVPLTPEELVVATQGPQGNVGPQGPPGPQGLPGSAGYGYTQAFETATKVWLVTHNLGYYPDLQTYDTTGREIWGEVQNIDLNNLTVTYSVPLAGTARCA